MPLFGPLGDQKQPHHPLDGNGVRYSVLDRTICCVPALQEDLRNIKHEYHEGPKAGENFEQLARAVF
jgi:hypothetical protein